jgi:hypothetical protein
LEKDITLAQSLCCHRWQKSCHCLFLLPSTWFTN